MTKDIRYILKYYNLSLYAEDMRHWRGGVSIKQLYECFDLLPLSKTIETCKPDGQYLKSNLNLLDTLTYILYYFRNYL